MAEPLLPQIEADYLGESKALGAGWRQYTLDPAAEPIYGAYRSQCVARRSDGQATIFASGRSYWLALRIYLPLPWDFPSFGSAELLVVGDALKLVIGEGVLSLKVWGTGGFTIGSAGELAGTPFSLVLHVHLDPKGGRVSAYRDGFLVEELVNVSTINGALTELHCKQGLRTPEKVTARVDAYETSLLLATSYEDAAQGLRFFPEWPPSISRPAAPIPPEAPLPLSRDDLAELLTKLPAAPAAATDLTPLEAPLKEIAGLLEEIAAHTGASADHLALAALPSPAQPKRLRRFSPRRLWLRRAR